MPGTISLHKRDLRPVAREHGRRRYRTARVVRPIDRGYRTSAAGIEIIESRDAGLRGRSRKARAVNHKIGLRCGGTVGSRRLEKVLCWVVRSPDFRAAAQTLRPVPVQL